MAKYRVIRYYTYAIECDVEAETPSQAFELTREEANEVPQEDMDFVDTDGYMIFDECGNIVDQSN